MSEKTYGLSQKAMTEKYEDLLFTKVMAQYAEKESERILAEMEAQNAENAPKPDPAAIGRLYSKIERKENLSTLWRFSKKIITFAAMVVFVAFVSLSSVVVASAEAREAVAEAIYHLVLRETERYTEVSIGESTGFVDPEIYDWEGAFAPTYVPEGFVCTDQQIGTINKMVTYSCEEHFFIFSQSSANTFARIDTEDADFVEKYVINDSEAIIVKKNGFCVITWRSADTFLSLQGVIEAEEIVKIAYGIKPIGRTESEEPVEEYTFIDPEIYDWEGAYAPTYMPEGFTIGETYLEGYVNTVVYYCDNDFIIIDQMNQTFNLQVDTENAITEKIYLHNSEGLLVKKDELTIITWCEGETLFEISGTAATEEIIKVAEGLKPIDRTESEEPVEEYTFIDPEIYDWENAYGLTYLPKGYSFDELYDLGDTTKIINYTYGNDYISFSYLIGDSIYADTENADLVKNIMIGESAGLLIIKDELCSVYWNVGDVLFDVSGTLTEDEMIKIAEGVKPIN
ncbi:MAG: DUF4367 domain-containing protein [Oscillospiraceae bacterium]|nr:DUF4367 domain-containing protein [Oscillospiraceae bacterium]